MPKIDPSLYLHHQSNTRIPSNELGKDAFLKILMTQLQNQDPTNPMNDREFISQLAQFSSLEQMMKISNTLTDYVENERYNTIIKYSAMIGKEISYEQFDEITGESLGIRAGKVVSAGQQDGQAFLVLNNGDKVLAAFITEVRVPEKEQTEEQGSHEGSDENGSPNPSDS